MKRGIYLNSDASGGWKGWNGGVPRGGWTDVWLPRHRRRFSFHIVPRTVATDVLYEYLRINTSTVSTIAATTTNSTTTRTQLQLYKHALLTVCVRGEQQRKCSLRKRFTQ